ncbi:MAG: Gfo/Idh/MocA family oxidoreductase [Defluviitaleaceae bacterium]|nr:Gfo/Idh/MocA family oxidoreductase [Defluviitaleaceae bacterium]
MKTVFGLYGSGWRAEFFLRIAKALPEQFEVCGAITRSGYRAARIVWDFGVRCYKSADEMLSAAKPDFIILAVNRNAGMDIALDLLKRGIPVLMETPPAPDMESLERFRESMPSGAMLQIAEQYPMQPMHSARLAFLETGKIGAVQHAYISYSQSYHAMALMRKYLGIRFESVEITAKSFPISVVAGPGREGEPKEEKIVCKTQTVALLDFGGRTGLYNFESEQHRSWVRSSVVQIKGERGELYNTDIKYLKDFKTPIESSFIRKNLGYDENLEGHDLKGIIGDGSWYYRNPYQGLRFSDDEIAVAGCLESMVAYIQGGPDFYSFEEAAQDIYLALMVEKAAKSGERVTTEAR